MLADKELLLHEVADCIKPENGFVLLSYSQVPVNTMSDWRNELLQTGGELHVLKKRVFLKALEKQAKEEGKQDFSVAELEGHIGVVQAHEGAFLDIAKKVFAFQKDSPDTLKVLGGFFDGSKCTAQDVEQISKLPPLEQLRGEIVGLLEAPMVGVVSACESLLSSILYCIENKSEKK